MRKTFLVFTIAFLVLGIYSCEKETKITACDNGKKDNDETEIDCGGSCQACPDPAYFRCLTNNIPYVTSNLSGQKLTPSIRINANNGSLLNFMFIPNLNSIGQPVVISSANLNFAGEPYNLEPGEDTGSVVLTSIDTLRQIVSGTFSFRAQRITSNQKVYVQEGVFTNVRYR